MTINNKDVSVGDKVKIITPKEEVEGTLLESSDSSLVLVKLKSGYNIGLTKEEIMNIELVSKKEEKKEKFSLTEKKTLPYIDVIITGGTISSRVDYKTGGNTWLTSPEELFKFYPELFGVVNVNQIKIPFMKSSEDMVYEDWQIISEEVEKSLNNKDVKGVIITHGTDFLHYTSSALSFFLKNLNKPVVLTYAQRSSDRASSDAEMNLLCSAYASISDIAEVMLVGHAGSNDDFCYAHRGTKVRKLHSSRRDAFKSVNDNPIAKIYSDGKIEITNDYNKRDDDKKVKLDNSFDKNVFLLKYFPGQSKEILNYISSRYKGLVIEGSGLGHVAVDSKESWLQELKKAINNGLTVCMTSQTIYGKVDEFVYSPARELEKAGVIYLKDMLAETALVKLGYVLSKTKNCEKIKEMMLSNIAKEFNSRLEE
jgi:glutamyl-tRNA(Gln) amidotransferase subunit D